MSFYRDKEIKGYIVFLIFFSMLLLSIGVVFGMQQISNAKALYLAHDEAVASSLLAQGISRDAVANALTNTEICDAGRELLTTTGIGNNTENKNLPFIYQFQKSTFNTLIIITTLLCLILSVGTFVFFWKRKRLFEQAEEVLTNYINGDYSCHLPQNNEGTIYQIFALVEQLATMLESKNEAEHKTKIFLKSTISDISHQLKTPLAALTMYQEIIKNEADKVEVVTDFSVKIEIALQHIEQLIQSMLKITRLDAGNIVFEKGRYHVLELIEFSINELTTRAKNEDKQILVDGDSEQQIECDLKWMSEAIGNIVKNALDYTKPGGNIHITWERTTINLHIFISDNGDGIAPEDIHHIFKRFYRSQHPLKTQGIGLGLPLAKSIIEGQGGFISVQSELNEGTTFTLSFLTEL